MRNANPKLKLYTFSPAPFVQPVVITLMEKGLSFDLQEVDVKRDKPDWFLRLSPTGNVPILEIDGKTHLFESTVICEYLDDTFGPRFAPEDPLSRAKHRSWSAFAGDQIATILFEIIQAKTEAALDQSVWAMRAALAKVAAELTGGRYFAGDEPALIDFAYAPFLLRLDILERAFGLDVWHGNARLGTWVRALLERPSTLGSVPDTFEESFLRWIVNSASPMAKRAHTRAASVDSLVEAVTRTKGRARDCVPADPYLLERISSIPPGRVLDVGCGTGGLCIALAERGWQATGVDRSPDAIAVAREVARTRGVNVDFVIADATTWTPVQHFDLVTCHFGLPPSPDDRRAVYSMSRNALAPSGVVLMKFCEGNVSGFASVSGYESLNFGEVAAAFDGFEIAAPQYVQIPAHRHGHREHAGARERGEQWTAVLFEGRNSP
jgi:glutathione S-transferase